MTATSSPAEPPESTLAAVKSALLAGLLDEYGEDAETWTAMRSLDRIAAAILAATPTAAHVAEPEAALAAAEAREAGIRFRVEVACDGYSALTDADVPMADGGGFDEDPDSYIAGAKAAADAIRAALTPPQPAP